MGPATQKVQLNALLHVFPLDNRHACPFSQARQIPHISEVEEANVFHPADMHWDMRRDDGDPRRKDCEVYEIRGIHHLVREAEISECSNILRVVPEVV